MSASVQANPEPVPFFQYPVHSDVESSSKFHVVKRAGQTLKPFRRACLLSRAQLLAFCDRVAAAF